MSAPAALDRRASGPPSGTVLVPGEFPLAVEDFRRISAILYEEAGIALPEAKATLLCSRLAKRLRSLGMRSFADYRRRLDDADGQAERRELVTALTTNVTRFFREPHHFEHLRTQVLPPLLDAARRGQRVRIWSAAASNGSEPYSIALEILRRLPDAERYDVRVLATDIDPTMIAAGREGVYSKAALEPVAAELRDRWFMSDGPGSGMFRATDALRGLVAFRELNLIGSWPIRQRFDAVFCRNVVIYFDEPTQARLWTRMAPLIVPQGVLYLGHSERLVGEAATEFRAEAITTYRRLPGATAGSGGNGR